ncbi:hypothetical protein GRX01_06620 [Halobaculum sp. WSA2]|uniref:Uncharacterized protein n=1 Tax=Halobaculum saliterrae TaxID=2073113 RepID=A0A6B0SQ19_9EURY|nr:hypothetical protein [Halobaculum saliterrae]MXR41014.1 hypothetical protein [Halobaculum saliterrae]
MVRTILVGLLLVSLLVVPATTVAKESPTATPTTETTPGPADDERPGEAEVFGDPAVYIESWSYSDGVFRIVFNSSAYRPSLTLTAPVEHSQKGANRGAVISRELLRGSTVVEIASPTGEVSITTSTSIRSGVYTKLDADEGGALVAGPWDGTDVRDAGIGGSLGVALAVVLGALSVVSGDSNEGERIA